MASWGIIESELIEWLKSYGGPRYHAVVSDPPYALISIAKRFGKAGSAPAQEGSDGRYSRLSGGFMGQKWDGFESLEHYQKWVSKWSELMIERLLYPGAVCLFFGGTRTFHHLGVGLENGGFEIVDSILIPWIHGQGFPKSHDISKGLDKAAGVEREVIGVKSYPREGTTPVTRKATSIMQQGEGENVGQESNLVTAPATPEAEVWDGYGTALKPAWEPVFVCRAPRRGLTRSWTFAELAVEFGTGALNIDGSRIGHSEPDEIMQPHSPDFRGVVYNDAKVGKERDGSDALASPNPAGRWPANFILSHAGDCVKVGEYTVDGRTLNRYPSHGAGGSFAFYAEDHKGEEYDSEEMPPDVVERWACVSECPVRMLNDQAGELHGRGSAGKSNPSYLDKSESMFGTDSKRFQGSGISDYGGGPSRFFYTAKASRSEKDKGLEHFWWKRTEDGFERISLSEYEKLDKRERAHGCIHPTVKPLELLRYLSMLLLPPKQEGRIRRILVPFSGVGSEIIGACQAGWDEVLGIEMESNYVMMATAHIRATIGMF